VAHSLGGWAALRLTLRRASRIAALVLSSSWTGIQLPELLGGLNAREPQLRAARAAWRRRVRGSFMPGCGARMTRKQPALHWLASSIASLNRDAAEAVWRRDAHGEFDPKLSPKTDPDELEGWSVPTLCLTGDEDFIVPSRAVERVAEALDARLVRMRRTGHSVFLERPAEFNRAVRSFLRRHARPRR
jgi:pimeloyl-ACP methyl ester carboxylesterase